MTIPSHLAPLSKGKWCPEATGAAIQFLTDIWDYHGSQYTFLCTRAAGSKRMQTHAIRRDRAAKIAKVFDAFPADRNDIYFCVNPFDRSERQAVYAGRTRYAWCDIDRDDPHKFKPKPNVLWETSSGSYQGLWIWPDYASPEEAQQYSRNLHRRYGGDATWDAPRLLRVPGTINHKKDRNGDFVRLIRVDPEPRPLRKVIADLSDMQPIGFSLKEVNPHAHDPAAIMDKYRRAMSLFARSAMEARRIIWHDKSEAVFAIACERIKQRATDDEVGCVLWDNPHFVRRGQNIKNLEAEIARARAKTQVTQ